LLIQYRDACDLLGIPGVTADRWLREGNPNFPKPTRIGRQRYYLRAELIAWIERRGKIDA
jgi:predicted DNA-binding transcriptional regulator AlpA